MDLLEQLQDDIFRRIEGNSMFANVACFKRNAPENEAMAGSQTIIDEALFGLTAKNGRNGCGVVIFTPEITLAGTETPGPEIQIEILISVAENYLQNRDALTGTGRTAGELAVFVLQLFDQFSPRPNYVVRPDNKNAVRERDVDGGRAYDISLRIPVNLAPQPACAAPTITVGGSTTTIASSEAGVTIHYTTDGSLPGRDSPLYTGAIPNLPEDGELRAIAAKHACLDSSGALHTF